VKTGENALKKIKIISKTKSISLYLKINNIMLKKLKDAFISLKIRKKGGKVFSGKGSLHLRFEKAVQERLVEFDSSATKFYLQF